MHGTPSSLNMESTIRIAFENARTNQPLSDVHSFAWFLLFPICLIVHQWRFQLYGFFGFL